VYPGCACDVPSHLYSFSFAPTRKWSRVYAPQPDIWAYLKDCVKRFNIQDHIVYSTKIVECVFDEEQGAWHLTSEDGRKFTSTVTVVATGGDPRQQRCSSSSSSSPKCSSYRISRFELETTQIRLLQQQQQQQHMLQPAPTYIIIPFHI
jgi:uncharacterized NAD(P)/FAD-binding protein YdhS